MSDPHDLNAYQIAYVCGGPARVVMVAAPTWSGISGNAPTNSACWCERRCQVRIISWITTAITTTTTAAKISDPTSVPEFMPDTSHLGR